MAESVASVDSNAFLPPLPDGEPSIRDIFNALRIVSQTEILNNNPSLAIETQAAGGPATRSQSWPAFSDTETELHPQNVMEEILQLLRLRLNPPFPAFKTENLTDAERARSDYGKRLWATKCAEQLLHGRDPSIYWPYRRVPTSITYAPSIDDGIDYHQSAISLDGTPMQIVKKARLYYENLGWQIKGEIAQIPYNTDRSAFLRNQLGRVQARLSSW